MHPSTKGNDNNNTKYPQMESIIEVFDAVMIKRDFLLENEFDTKFIVSRAQTSSVMHIVDTHPLVRSCEKT